MPTTTDPLVATVAAEILRLSHADRPLMVAVSGGPDSLSLLHLMLAGQSIHGRQIVVGHVDHGIASDSAAVTEQLLATTARLGVASEVRRVKLGSQVSETTARAARRPALLEMANRVGARLIATAHHADDQIETILLRVLRGSGPAGLAGIAPRRGRWIRPLLSIRRSELRDWLADRGELAWHDPANMDPRHLRSWLRGEVLPLLTRRMPDVGPRLLELASQAAESRSAWNELPELLVELAFSASEGAVSVAAEPLRGYRSAVRAGLLAALGRRLGVPLGRRQIERLEGLLGTVHSGRRVQLSPHLDAELSFGRLVLHRPAESWPATLLPKSGALAVGNHRLVVSPDSAGELTRIGSSTWLRAGSYEVRPWQRGDRIRPLGGTGSRQVVVLLREARIAVVNRSSWPVVVSGSTGEIVWLPGVCRSELLMPEPGEESLNVEFKPG